MRKSKAGRILAEMTGTALKANLKDILALRGLFLQETNFQVRYNACHERGWSDSYLLKLDGVDVGYGSIKGQERNDRDTIFEFYVVPPFRKHAGSLFEQLISVSRARYIECHVRSRRADDHIFEHTVEPVGDYVLEIKQEIVATGGFMLHYNAPFADLYMEVRKDCRRQGYGTFILQELQKECYLAGRVPAARCQIKNVASRATLLKSGLRICGFMQFGNIKNPS